MAPEKTDPDSGEESPNASTVSLDTSALNDSEREPYFEPVVQLPEVQVRTNEEDEEEIMKLRCKLFRFCNEESPGEWKERGTGDVKILHHHDKKTVRIVMRQDKTLKIRANHYITPYMELLPNCDSDRAYVWSSNADYADEETRRETFAIKFANSEHAKLFKDKFNEGRSIMTVYIVKDKEKKEENNSKPEIPSEKKTETKSDQKEVAKSVSEVDEELQKLSVSDKKAEPLKSE